MGVYVVLTVWLARKARPNPKNATGRRTWASNPTPPRPVRWGGAWLRLYQHALSFALFGLFLEAFCLHARGGATVYNIE